MRSPGRPRRSLAQAASLAGLLLGCTPAPEPTAQPTGPAIVPADAAVVVAAMGLARLETDAPLAVEIGEPTAYPGYTVSPLSFEAWPGFRTSAALWLPEGEGPFPGVLVLPGHFGEGKAAGECQEVAHALAARGYAALAVDMPGVEEWEGPDRQLHFESGAHNRAVLLAAGSSALGLQVHVSRRGLDALVEAAPVDRIAATGASGGAVLAFYLALAEPRVHAIALASFVGIPREEGGGCFCDALPGSPGPDPATLAALPQTSLWMGEIPRERLEGLPSNALFHVLPGPHSYTAEMRTLALPWLDEQLGWEPPDTERAQQVLEQPPYTPGAALRSPTDHGALSITALAQAVGGPAEWAPRPDLTLRLEPVCVGEGDKLVTAGATLPELMALGAAGFDTCSFTLPPDEPWEGTAIAEGRALVDRPASALKRLSEDLGGAPVYATGPWAIAAAASGVPWVGRAPLTDLSEVDPQQHPPWVHVPGGWWGGLDVLYSSAIAIDDDMDVLIEALKATTTHSATTTRPG